MRILLFILLGMSVLLVNCAKDNPEDLLGKWEVIKVIDKDNHAYKPDETLTLEFISMDSYALLLDINECAGNYSVSDNNEIEFIRPGCTRICCDSEASDGLSDTVFRMTEYQLRGKKLILTGEGKIVLKEK